MVNLRYDINGTIAFTSAEKLTPVAAAEGGEGAASDAAGAAAATYKRAPLGMEVTVCGSLNPKEVQLLTEAELEMCNVDRLKKETDEARNNCEAFCYKIRDELEVRACNAMRCDERRETRDERREMRDER